jgi:ABC-type lipoprotein release transport system permease subunit
MARLFAIAQTGLASLILHPLRALVTVAAVTSLLMPYVTCLAISQGIEAEAKVSVRAGADLYVRGQQLGRSVPIRLTVADEIRRLEGVTRVVPRIVGSIALGAEDESAVLVGLPAEELPTHVQSLTGRLPRPGRSNELVIGTELARRLVLKIGSRILPFYHSEQGERVSEVVGIFMSDAPLWQSRMILTSFETAAAIFDVSDLATDLLVYCRPRYANSIAATIRRGLQSGKLRSEVTTRADLQALVQRDVLHREGVFNLHFVLAFAIGILVVLVTSGIGLTERRREIGILKATGWQTDELLLRGLTESFLLSLAGAALSLVLSAVWLKVFNGFGIAMLFLAGTDTRPAFDVPSRFTPVPALLAFVLSFAVVLCGTLISTWRAAKAAPLEAMR